VTAPAPERSTDRRGLARVVKVLLVLVGVGPFVPPLVTGIPGLELLGRALEGWFGLQCHRDPARSLSLLGHVLPVCARCLGIYAGLGLGGLVAWPRLRAAALRLWVFGAAAVMVLDVLTEALGLHPEWRAVRIASGVLLAYPVGAALVHAARYG